MINNLNNLHIHRDNKPDKFLIAKRNLRAFGRDLDRLWTASLAYRDSEYHLLNAERVRNLFKVINSFSK